MAGTVSSTDRLRPIIQRLFREIVTVPHGQAKQIAFSIKLITTCANQSDKPTNCMFGVISDIIFSTGVVLA